MSDEEASDKPNILALGGEKGEVVYAGFCSEDNAQKRLIDHLSKALSTQPDAHEEFTNESGTMHWWTFMLDPIQLSISQDTFRKELKKLNGQIAGAGFSCLADELQWPNRVTVVMSGENLTPEAISEVLMIQHMRAQKAPNGLINRNDIPPKISMHEWAMERLLFDKGYRAWKEKEDHMVMGDGSDSPYWMLALPKTLSAEEKRTATDVLVNLGIRKEDIDFSSWTLYEKSGTQVNITTLDAYNILKASIGKKSRHADITR